MRQDHQLKLLRQFGKRMERLSWLNLFGGTPFFFDQIQSVEARIFILGIRIFISPGLLSKSPGMCFNILACEGVLLVFARVERRIQIGIWVVIRVGDDASSLAFYDASVAIGRSLEGRRRRG